MSRRAIKEMFFARQVVPMVVGTMLYVALTIPFNVTPLAGAGGVIALKPSVAIPMVLGIIFGPIAGFVVGLVGNALSDFLSFGGIFSNWELGIGLLGAIPGIAYFIMKKADWTKARGVAIAAVLAVVAAVVGIGFVAITEYMFQIGIATANSAMADFYYFAGDYALNGAIFTPILLYAYGMATGHPRRRK